MLPFNRPVTDIMKQRHSCRAYDKTPITAEHAGQLPAFAETITHGPLGTPLRFELALALPHDPKALRGLGTYGLIKDPAGFIVGAMGQGGKNLEDFGYSMETVILYATSLGLGSCWLGGNFTKSSFASEIRAAGGEVVPAVASIGYAAAGIRTRDLLRQMVNSDCRLSWQALFFRSKFEAPLAEEAAGAYAGPLAMLRLAPSSHNYQPWRVVQDDVCYHFYLQRTPGYGPGTLTFALLRMADLQRADIGIAMCHFELAARELGLAGTRLTREPVVRKPAAGTEYVASWAG